MTSNNSLNTLPPVPAQRYFSLDELCRLADISPAQFSQWQQQHGIVLGRGGHYYSRLDVMKLRQLRATFDPYIDGFTRNQTDAHGQPAIDGDETRQRLQALLEKIETALVK